MFWLAFQLHVACQSTFFPQLTLCALALLHAWIVLHISTGWFNRSPRHHQTSFIFFFSLLLLPISAHLNSWGSSTFWGNGLGTLTMDVCECDGLITSPSINQSKEKAWPTLFLFWTNKQQNVQNNTRRLYERMIIKNVAQNELVGDGTVSLQALFCHFFFCWAPICRSIKPRNGKRGLWRYKWALRGRQSSLLSECWWATWPNLSGFFCPLSDGCQL